MTSSMPPGSKLERSLILRPERRRTGFRKLRRTESDTAGPRSRHTAYGLTQTHAPPPLPDMGRDNGGQTTRHPKVKIPTL